MKQKHVILLHIIFWIIFIGMPLLSAYLSGWDLPLRYFVRLYIMAVFDFITFYITYFYIKPQNIFKGNPSFIISILLLIFSLVIIRITTYITVYYFSGIQLQKTLVSKGVFIEDTFDTIMFIVFPMFIKLLVDWTKTEKLKAELLAQTKSSEIALLRSQINPHFLFNTLNNIYSLVYQKSENASSVIMRLSEIMRYMLYDTNSDKVPLDKELKYIRSFIELQEIRIDNKQFVTLEINGETNSRFIAPMILIPFIENAFKHGSKKVDSPGIIIKFNAEEGKYIFEVTNYIKQYDEVMDKEGGIGLQNLKRRLELIYPSKHKLDIKTESGIYSIHLEIEEQ